MTEVENKDPTTTLAYISSDPPRPVGPVHPTGRTGRLHAADSTGQTGPTGWSDRSTQTERLHTQPTSVQLDSAIT